MNSDKTFSPPLALSRPFGRTIQVGIVFFGIILPIATLIIEITTHFCVNILFDPIPTFWHILLISTVPLSNFLVFKSLYSNNRSSYHRLGFLNAFSIGVSLMYAIPFVPVMPMALVGIIWYGLGLLPLSPSINLVVALYLRHQLRKVQKEQNITKLPRPYKGFATSVLVMGLLSLPSFVTAIGINMFESDDVLTSKRGLALLRAVGSDRELLKLCYLAKQTRDFSPFSIMNIHLMDNISPEQAQSIYYRVTGVGYDTKPMSKKFRNQRDNRWFNFDTKVGQQTVGGIQDGVELSSSTINTSIDALSAVSYTEWTLVFTNHTKIQQEARTQLELPPGGVVSRLTLWINGEEQEAAFGKRSQTVQAYKNVVQQKRDPVLVTTSGPDRVMAQLFPIQPNGGVMKVRIGITAPLVTEQSQRYFRLPHFIEHNFKIPNSLKHAVWIDSEHRMTSKFLGLTSDNNTAGAQTLEGLVNNRTLNSYQATVKLSDIEMRSITWADDTKSNNGEMIKQTLSFAQAEVPQKLIVLIDASRSMKDHASNVFNALKQIPETIETTFITNEEPILTYTNVDSLMAKTKFLGGRDNVPALEKALKLAARENKTAILWIHGPQPVTLEQPEILNQIYSRFEHPIPLYDFPINTGTNVVAKEIGTKKAYTVIARIRSESEDLLKLFSLWSREHLEASFSRFKIPIPPSNRIDKGSSHITRLWAYDQALRYLTTKNTTAAANIAISYQLVTPVSGAVVLETASQYSAAGLTPVKPGTVPTIPEPEHYALMLIAAAMLLIAYKQRRAQPCSHP